jgi:hypothetical protein
MTAGKRRSAAMVTIGRLRRVLVALGLAAEPPPGHAAPAA